MSCLYFSSALFIVMMLMNPFPSDKADNSFFAVLLIAFVSLYFAGIAEITIDKYDRMLSIYTKVKKTDGIKFADAFVSDARRLLQNKT